MEGTFESYYNNINYIILLLLCLSYNINYILYIGLELPKTWMGI